MIFFISIALVSLLIFGVLFVPVTGCIDTISNQYYIKIHGLAKANLEGHKTEIVRIRLVVLFFQFYLYPLRKRRVKQVEAKKSKGKLKLKKRMSFKKMFRIIRTFKITRFLLDIDTDDTILNAKLYPLFSLLKYNGANCNINFQGRNQLVLYVRNRPIHIIKSIINF